MFWTTLRITDKRGVFPIWLVWRWLSHPLTRVLEWSNYSLFYPRLKFEREWVTDRGNRRIGTSRRREPITVCPGTLTITHSDPWKLLKWGVWTQDEWPLFLFEPSLSCLRSRKTYKCSRYIGLILSVNGWFWSVSGSPTTIKVGSINLSSGVLIGIEKSPNFRFPRFRQVLFDGRLRWPWLKDLFGVRRVCVCEF